MKARASARLALVAGLLVAVLPILPAGATVTNISPTWKGYNPIAESFSSADDGYVLSLLKCQSLVCATLSATKNDGADWRTTQLPYRLSYGLLHVRWAVFTESDVTLQIHFASARNGWIYGDVPKVHSTSTTSADLQDFLWSTHDGGRTWKQIRLGPLHLTDGVVQMATHGNMTYLFGLSPYKGFTTPILGTKSSRDDWVVKSKNLMYGPAGGIGFTGAFSFSGSQGWFISGNDRGLDATEKLTPKGTWVKWKAPKTPAFAGHFAPLNVVSKKLMFVVTTTAGFAIPPASTVPPGWNDFVPWLFVSYNGGKSFKTVRRLPLLIGGTGSDVPGFPAMPKPGVLLLMKDDNNTFSLQRSTNWGKSWQVALNHPLVQSDFVSQKTGFAIVDLHVNNNEPSRTGLMRSDDAGEHWIRIRIPDDVNAH